MKKTNNRGRAHIMAALFIMMSCFLFACTPLDNYSLSLVDEEIIGNTTTETEEDESLNNNASSADAGTVSANIAESEETYIEPLKPEDMTSFDIEKAMEYITRPICDIDNSGDNVNISFKFLDKVPRSDDDNIYIFALNTFEQEGVDENSKPIISVSKAKEIITSVSYRKELLFNRFFPAILYEGEYIPLSISQYINNPEILAKDIEAPKDFTSKKGLLLDANTVDKKELYDLNVKRVIYNIPLSYIIGESDSPACPTVEYEYGGCVYKYNGYMLAGFDSLFKNLTDNGFHTTAIILNDWNENNPEIIHPLSRQKLRRAMYYSFNTEEEEGTKLLEATAMFLADRYTGGEYGMVYDWVIANEVNQQAVWNYMNTDNLDYYAESFERGFRIFYNAIRSNYAYANVYFSIDQDWNNNSGNNKKYFNGKEFLISFNDFAKMRGNYDWGLSIHPYPSPLNNTKFWRGEYDKSEDAKVITPMNLSALTSVMTKPEFLDTNGDVRSIGVTELGFCSRVSEEAQAAAFAYCYYIIENNEYIDSFLLNRQHDDVGALKSGLSLGIYNYDYSKKEIADVFKNIDSKKGESYIPKMLKIIGEDSFEEALKRAE